MTSTKKDLVKDVSEKTGLESAKVKEIIQSMLETMCKGLAEDGNIELRNFGIFKIKTTPERTARNPKTSEIIKVPAKKHVNFKPGLLLKVKINQ